MVQIQEKSEKIWNNFLTPIRSKSNFSWCLKWWNCVRFKDNLSFPFNIIFYDFLIDINRFEIFSSWRERFWIIMIISEIFSNQLFQFIKINSLRIFGIPKTLILQGNQSFWGSQWGWPWLSLSQGNWQRTVENSTQLKSIWVKILARFSAKGAPKLPANLLMNFPSINHGRPQISDPLNQRF